MWARGVLILTSHESLDIVTLVATALVAPVLTWRHHHRAAATPCCVRQHAANLLPAVSALTFSTIIRLLLINSLACFLSVSFQKPATLSLSPGSLQQQQHYRETRPHSQNWSNKQDRKCLRANSCRPEICHVPWNIKGAVTRGKALAGFFSTCMHVGDE